MNKLGFGFLRLPRVDEHDEQSVDWPRLDALVDAYLKAGGRYFDTAFTYLGGMSEEAIRRSLVARHPRGAYLLADKLPGYAAKRPADCEAFFKKQLSRCGVEYFDVYMLHWLNPKHYAIAQELQEFDFLLRKKAEGRARKIGFSFHGDAALLSRILQAHPEVDVVQLQINYLDWSDPGIQSGACYDIAARYEKEVVVMGPAKGGMLAALPPEAEAILRAYAPSASPASWAMRFAMGLPAVSTVLSGMNAMEQLEDNLRIWPSLDAEEHALLQEVAAILRREVAIPCTDCRYCTAHCRRGIPIPAIFALYNAYRRDEKHGWKIQPAYETLTFRRGKASDCIDCRACEAHCPQGIGIAAFMAAAAKALEA